MEKYSVVYRRNGKEVGRSKGMEIEKALKIVRDTNRFNQDRTWKADLNAPYIEETYTVKHLPVVEG